MTACLITVAGLVLEFIVGLPTLSDYFQYHRVVNSNKAEIAKVNFSQKGLSKEISSQFEISGVLLKVMCY